MLSVGRFRCAKLKRLNALSDSLRERLPPSDGVHCMVTSVLKYFGLLSNLVIGAKPNSARRRLASSSDSSRTLLRE